MASPMRLTVPVETPDVQFWFVHPSHQKTEELDDVLHHSGDVLAPKLQEHFTEPDTEGNYVVPALDFRAQVLNIYDRRNGVGKPVFRLAPDGHERRFNVIAPGVSLMLLTMCCDKLLV